MSLWICQRCGEQIAGGIRPCRCGTIQHLDRWQPKAAPYRQQGWLDELEELYPAHEPTGPEADAIRARIRALETQLADERAKLRACRLPSRHDAAEDEQVRQARVLELRERGGR